MPGDKHTKGQILEIIQTKFSISCNDYLELNYLLSKGGKEINFNIRILFVKRRNLARAVRISTKHSINYNRNNNIATLDA